MMPSPGQLREELDRAEEELYRMMEKRFGAALLSGEDLQKKLTDAIREQRIIVTWLRAEYTGQLLRELREQIDGAEVDTLLGNSSSGVRGKIEEDQLKLGKLRSRHLDAYNLLITFENWQEVAKRYERSMGR